MTEPDKMSGAPGVLSGFLCAEDRMEFVSGNLNRHFLRYLFTSLGSAIVMSIYTSVDIICVGHYCGPDGSAAISCVNPLWSIMIALGLLLGVGGSVWMSARRGAGEEREADSYFSVALIVALILSLALMLVYLFLREPLLRFFGADDELLPYAMEYAQWLAWAAPIFLMGTMLPHLIRNDGAPGICAASTLTGGVVNIAGDIYFVFDFGLGMGMSGAGLATALGELVALCILCSYFLRQRCGLRLRRTGNVAVILRRICASGFAPAIVDLTFGITVILFNRQIMRCAGTAELAVFGTVANIAVLFQSLFYGVGQAVQPITSTNYGAGKGERVAQMRRIYLVTTGIMGVFFCAATLLLPRQLLNIYMAVTAEILEIGPTALRIYGISFLFMGVNVVSTYYLESVLRPRQSFVISLSRGLVLTGLFVMVLPPVFGVPAIWWTMPLTELLTMAYTLYALRGSVASKVLWQDA